VEAARITPGAPRVIKIDGRGSTRQEDALAARAVAALVDRAVCALTGAREVGAAYRQLFKPEDRVAIKVPSTIRPPMVAAVVKGLLAAGVPAGRVTLFDSPSGGFWQQEWCRTLVRETGVKAGAVQWHPEPLRVGNIAQRICRPLYDCTALINIASFNTHLQMEMTGALKNHMGSIDAPQRLHTSFEHSCGLLNHLPQIRDRLRLVLLDLLRPSLKGHPDFPVERYYKDAQTLIAARDPVAADAVGLELLRRWRASSGLSSELQYAHRQLTNAARLGLGQAKRAHIELVELKA